MPRKRSQDNIPQGYVEVIGWTNLCSVRANKMCHYIGICLCCKLHVCFAGRYTKHTFHLWRFLLWLGKDSLRKVIQLLIIRIYAPFGIILHLDFICFSKYFCTVQDINIILLDLAYQYVMS